MTDRAEAEQTATELLANMDAGNYAECVPLLADALFDYGKDKRRDGAMAVMGALSDGQAERLRNILRTPEQSAKCLECGAPMEDGECSRYSTGAPDDMPCHPGMETE